MLHGSALPGGGDGRWGSDGDAFASTARTNDLSGLAMWVGQRVQSLRLTSGSRGEGALSPGLRGRRRRTQGGYDGRSG